MGTLKFKGEEEIEEGGQNRRGGSLRSLKGL